MQSPKPIAEGAALQVRATLRLLTSMAPEHIGDVLAGALAEIVNRHISAYGPERTARLCERAAALVRSAPHDMKEV